jgi:hypothetical protein
MQMHEKAAFRQALALMTVVSTRRLSTAKS